MKMKNIADRRFCLNANVDLCAVSFSMPPSLTLEQVFDISISRAVLRKYLLEKSRIVAQGDSERFVYIFLYF